MPKYYGSNWSKNTEVSQQNLTPIQQYKQDHWKEAFSGTLVIPKSVYEEEEMRKRQRQGKMKKKCKQYGSRRSHLTKYELREAKRVRRS